MSPVLVDGATISVPPDSKVQLVGASEFGIARQVVAADSVERSSTTLTLAQAIHEAVANSIRIRTGSEKVRQAEADLRTEASVPNPTLLADSLLNPLPGHQFTRTSQGGPPQVDVGLNTPVDWLLFGKRTAAAEAARLGVKAAEAEFDDLIRRHVGEVITVYYDLLEADHAARLTREELEGVKRLEGVIAKQVAAGKADEVEIGRGRLFAADVQRSANRQELASRELTGKLGQFLGRVPDGASLNVQGDLTITDPAPVPDLSTALTTALGTRPDLRNRAAQVAKTAADVEKETRRAHPEVGIQPVFSYQFQRTAIGYPNVYSYGVAISTTLPIADQNQGNIDKSRSSHREAVLSYQEDAAQLRNEIQRAIDTFRLTRTAATANTAAEVEAARRLWEQAEAEALAGKGSWKDALEAHGAYWERRRGEISKRADYWRAFYALHVAVDCPRTE